MTRYNNSNNNNNKKGRRQEGWKKRTKRQGTGEQDTITQADAQQMRSKYERTTREEGKATMDQKLNQQAGETEKIKSIRDNL